MKDHEELSYLRAELQRRDAAMAQMRAAEYARELKTDRIAVESAQREDALRSELHARSAEISALSSRGDEIGKADREQMNEVLKELEKTRAAYQRAEGERLTLAQTLAAGPKQNAADIGNGRRPAQSRGGSSSSRWKIGSWIRMSSRSTDGQAEETAGSGENPQAVVVLCNICDDMEAEKEETERIKAEIELEEQRIAQLRKREDLIDQEDQMYQEMFTWQTAHGGAAQDLRRQRRVPAAGPVA